MNDANVQSLLGYFQCIIADLLILSIRLPLDIDDKSVHTLY